MKVSIITAAFNSGETLRDTLKSVLEQTYTNFEHIIVDGGSQDNTLEIIKEFEPLYDGRLKWISEPDNGIYDAMNKGIGMASGEIVGLLNSDDFYTDGNVLKTFVSHIKDYDAVYGDVHYVNPDDLNKVVRYYSSKAFRRRLMLMGFMPAHPSFYCRRKLFEQFGAFDTEFRVASDFELLLRFIYKNNISIKYIGKDFVTMRTGGASTSGFKSHRMILRDHLRAYKKNGIRSNIFLEGCRYAYKSFELIKQKFYNHSIE